MFKVTDYAALTAVPYGMENKRYSKTSLKKTNNWFSRLIIT